MAAVLMASKVLGFFRDWAILTVYGASTATDAYFAAVQLPQASIVLLGGLGGPFHTATIAVLSRLLTKDENGDEHLTEKAKQLAATFTTLTGVAFLGLSALAYLFADPIMHSLLGGVNDPALLTNAAKQLKIMSPVIFIGGLVGILYGALNLLQVYVWPALSPSALSIAILAALWFFPADDAGMLLAWSTLAGAGLQLLLQLPQYLRKGFTLKPTLASLKTEECKQLGEILFPAMIGTTIGQLTTFVDMAFAAHLPEGGWSAVTLSNRLVQLPIGVLQTALLVPLFPRLSKLAAEGQIDELARQARLGIGSLWLVIIPILVWLLFFIQPVITTVFEHGSFDAQDTAMVSVALFWQLGSMLPYFARDTLTRVFYAFQDSRTPLLIGVMAIGLKALLNWALVSGWLNLGVGGITLAITLVTFWNALWLGWLSRKYVPNFGFLQLGKNLSKMLLAGGVMVASLWGLQQLELTAWLNQVLTLPDLVSQWTFMLGAGLVSTALYAGVLILLGGPEMTWLLNRLSERFNTISKN